MADSPAPDRPLARFSPLRLFRGNPNPVLVSPKRKAVALAVAAAADIAQVALMPLFVEGAASPFDDALDAVTAVLLLAILGFRWRLVLALAAELVPGLDLFPSWTAVVLSIATAKAPAPAPAPVLPTAG